MNPDPNTPPPAPPASPNIPNNPWQSVTPPPARNMQKRTDPFEIEPMTEPPTTLNALAALLRAPGRILHQLNTEGSSSLAIKLLGCTILCLAVFGFLLGTFSGGAQLWAAPTKVVLGTLASGLICLPSLVIFSLLSGTDCSIAKLGSLLLISMALVGLLLVGFAPVVWVFAQSSSEVGFMGGLGLIFWILSCAFGLRLLLNLADKMGAHSKGALLAWGAIFMLVTFQMTSTLRPILGTSDTFLPETKMSFLEYWTDGMEPLKLSR
jgi:hypothetical protein